MAAKRTAGILPALSGWVANLTSDALVAFPTAVNATWVLSLPSFPFCRAVFHRRRGVDGAVPSKQRQSGNVQF